MYKKIRAKNILKILISILVLLIIYNEFLIYYLKTINWVKISCDGVESTNSCLKILLVADPQLLGQMGESWATRWDCDRYLSKTYNLAKSFFSPDLVIFLGDLMDEGSIADDDQYQIYLDRFNKIFSLKDTKNLFVPGDNDIGGENEPLSYQKIQRFQKTFSYPFISADFENITFYDVNRLLYHVPNKHKNNNTNILLTHLPLLYTPSNYVNKVLEKLKPNLIFTAHEHKSMVIKGSLNDESIRIITILRNGDKPLNLKFESHTVYEILVPTCSYRMGVKEMGYGAAVYDSKNKNLKYTVFWLPNRLEILLNYVYSLPILFIIFIILFFKRKYRF